MDKLRAIEYFVRVVEAGSFAAAARELEVSPPAVTTSSPRWSASSERPCWGVAPGI